MSWDVISDKALNVVEMMDRWSTSTSESGCNGLSGNLRKFEESSVTKKPSTRRQCAMLWQRANGLWSVFNNGEDKVKG